MKYIILFLVFVMTCFIQNDQTPWFFKCFYFLAVCAHLTLITYIWYEMDIMLYFIFIHEKKLFG